MKWYEWYARLFSSRQAPVLAAENLRLPTPLPRPDPRPVRVEPEQLPGLPFSKSYYPPAYPRQEPPGVVFTDPATGEQREILDARGRFVDFPGIDRAGLEDEKEMLDRVQAHPAVRYRAEFSRFGRDSYLIYWMIQPDGRYWADEDGFGGTSDPEISLYALLDEKGRYRGPFRLYSQGRTKYFWSHPVIRLRKEPNTRYVKQNRFVEWIERPEQLADEGAVRRLPLSQCYTYLAKGGFSALGRDYAAPSELLYRPAEGRPGFYRDIYGRLVLELHERFPCFDADDYAYENRYYHWIYLWEKGVLWCVFYADQGDEITVTRDVEIIEERAWRKLVVGELATEAELQLLKLES